MQVFLSYASEDRQMAEEIQLALTGAGHGVFFDREALLPAEDYHNKLRSAVREADLFVFLLSSHSLDQGSYALTELKFAREKWSHPGARVLPVLVEGVAWERIPIYLKAVTILEPEGNVAAEVAAAVDVLSREQATSPLHALQTAENEIVFRSDRNTTLAHVRTALQRLGRVTETDHRKCVVVGKVRFGLQSVAIRASVAEDQSHQSRVVIQASSDDIWSWGARSATKRLLETLRNLNTPGYKPDRLGMHPWALVAGVITFMLTVVIVLLYLLPRLLKLLG